MILKSLHFKFLGFISKESSDHTKNLSGSVAQVSDSPTTSQRTIDNQRYHGIDRSWASVLSGSAWT